MSSILDRSGNYLNIFINEFVINHDLPKWKILDNSFKKNDEVQKNDDNGKVIIGNNITISNLVFTNSNEVTKKESSEIELSLSDFLKLDVKDFNFIVNKNVARDIMKINNFNSFIDSSGSTINSSSSSFEESKKHKGIFSIVTRNVKRFFNDNESIDKEDVYVFDALQFFSKIKSSVKENDVKYAKRIEPYLIAMKQAKDCGQQALVDKLVKEIFNIKYESILYTEGFHYKISEQQIVDFVKKSEKGIQLCYLANFIRPIPTEVFDKKKKADDLLVFDNYCILYYDPENKSYSKTNKQIEAERMKKSDPILFGMISGSRDLYYITDWVDEYCDLTLDEFIKVSGLEKVHLKIDEKIKF